jgi:hypothetical protein
MAELKCRIGTKILKKGKTNKTNEKTFEQNTKRKSQMLPKHPLTLKMHQHGKHLHPKPPTKWMKRKNENKKSPPKILILSIGQQN